MKLFTDESGQTIVVAAVFMSLVALGFLAFALDTGSLIQQKRMAQGAADAAALAAAEELTAGDPTNEQTAANAVSKLNGFDTTLATNPAVVTLSTPASGNYTGSAYIQATVSKPIPTMFLSAFRSSWATMQVSATSIAGGAQVSQTCVCLQGTSGQDLYMSNGSKINASTCGIVENSGSSNAIGIVGATLTALILGTVSTDWDNSSNVNNGGTTGTTTIVQGITDTCAGSPPAAPSYSSCVGDPGGSGGTYSFGPASASSVICYTGLTIGANSSIDTLKPGIYVISNGYLTFDTGSGGHSNLGGQGVFFYLTGTASLTIQSGANVNLVSGGATESGGGTAPTVGIYNGVVIYQAASDTQAMTIDGGSTSFINGGIYASGAAVTLNNGSGATVEGGIDVATLNMSGGGTLTPTADINDGNLSTGVAKLMQ